MAIHDKDPERRNLVITSLSFIIFCLAGGHLSDDNIRLQLINISFKNTEVLIISAWLMIAWFALRYWQTHKGLVKQEIEKDVSTLLENRSVINYVKKAIKNEYRVKDGFNIISIQKNHGTWSITHSKVTNTKTNSRGKLIHYSQTHSDNLELEGTKALFLIAKLYIVAIIIKPSFTSYAVPYLLFYAAVYLGTKHLL